ncbi:nuclear transport factor 2 family protein [Bradyrhizobium sp. 195]|uniref:nuclear transport factor 2 family protein n=1 Tax=Bradyrhizobium sp. 195 TaxID=2782662 RepID=UPI002000BE6C|nr:nuclear transport factor 2 family protein [Bradyrhizobium sp. 195]UPK26391.1 nuclear transport factor 2 family protein [Bradyrhizobium sp. 195]
MSRRESTLKLARARLKAYIDKDRAAIEAVLSDDYRFSSPVDNQLDRATYLSRCWPNSERTTSFDEMLAIEDGDRAVIVYEAAAGDHKFRNCEVATVRGDKIVRVEVYFGWDLPHKAPRGGFIENAGEGHA